MVDFKMETTAKVGVINTNGKYQLELRKTKVNDGEEKWDIRQWTTDDDGNEKCNKGIRLTDDELYKLAEIINNLDAFD